MGDLANLEWISRSEIRQLVDDFPLDLLQPPTVMDGPPAPRGVGEKSADEIAEGPDALSALLVLRCLLDARAAEARPIAARAYTTF